MAKQRHKVTRNTQFKIAKLLDLSKAELLNKGLTNFNYEKVISDANLSKSTVYKKFGKKDDFIIVVIQSILDEFYVPFKKYVDDFKSFKEVLDFISHLNFDVKELLKKYPIEDIFQNRRISGIINDYYYQRFGKVIVEKIKEFQSLGEIRNDVQAEYILEFLTSITKGMGLMLKDHDFKEVLNNYTKLIQSALSYNSNLQKE
jgi:AcrR family transcriptional regulator